MKFENLKPCPKCGGKVVYHPFSHRINNFYNKPTIVCPDCGFRLEGRSELQLYSEYQGLQRDKRE